ncbi:MAG: efflux RND transporter periplasmic adaptor subunit [Oligoflexia bacterium]|nr:efflux RND transporter periplasmic adaptor subunit [Oligoflexia bacterium]
MKAMTTVGCFLILLITITFGLISSCSKQNSSSPSTPEEKEYWTCSMHPQIHQEQPGKCPICGMDLIKVIPDKNDNNDNKATDSQNSKAEQSYPSGHGPITLSSSQQQMIGVKFGKVIKKNSFKIINTAGRVAFDPELFTAQNEYLEALRQSELIHNSPIGEIKRSAHKMVESAKMRLKILGLSNQQIEALKNNSSVGTGLLIPKKGEPLWVYAEVYEVDLSYVRPQMKANIKGHFLGGDSLVGEVISVDRLINPTTRTAKVRIALAASNLEIRPESYVEVNILSPLGEQLLVPFNAILDSGKESWVFVVKDKEKIEPRKITITNYLGDEVTVGSGLTEGESIVTSANFLVDSESRLVGVREEVSAESEENKNKIICPEGKTWHEQMNHCM